MVAAVVQLFLAVVVTALLCFWGGLLWVTARVLIRVGKRMLGSTRRRHAVQRKKVRSIRLTKEKLATCFVVFCVVYVVVYVGQIIDLGTVNATSRSVLDMLSNEYDLRVLQSDQSVECVASQYTKEDICNDAQHWDWQITDPCQCQRHLPCVSMLVKLKLLRMHAEYSIFSSDVCPHVACKCTLRD